MTVLYSILFICFLFSGVFCIYCAISDLVRNNYPEEQGIIWIGLLIGVVLTFMGLVMLTHLIQL
jgi:hypothetical protein